jgi:hypothetical protein
MTDEQEALDAAARAVQGVQHATGRAHGLVRDNPAAYALLGEANDHAQTALDLLISSLGARRPGLQVARDTLPLELLSTPATRALVEALEAAHAIACQVDVERGWIDEDGEAIGFGEALGGMLLGLRREVYGARGGGLE